MKYFLQSPMVLFLCAAAWPPQAQNAPHPQANSAAPPEIATYTARTDRKPEPYKDAPPEIGPAGSVISDPSFGSRILRVTDAKSDNKQPGRPLFTPSSAEQNSWNTNSTMLYVDTAGGSFLLYAFDPSAMKARLLDAPNLPWNGEPQFSYSQPNMLYGMARRDPVFEQYDVAKGKVSTVNDASKCVKLQGSDTGHAISVSADDNRFAATLGPQQDRNYIVYIYDRTQGCRWYNTQTGEIGGQWGPKGTIALPDRFLVHNARISKSGKFIYVVRSGAPGIGKGWVVWEIDTLNTEVCDRACNGHHVMGYSHLLGASGMEHPLNIWSWPLGNLKSPTPIISGLEPAKDFWYDSHYSWNNDDPSDTSPVCFSTYRPTNPDEPGKPLLVTGPWQNEIDCAETDGKGSRIWRFAHTYSTAKNGFWSQPRGNVSQDGRFFMFSSDWQDQLGKMPTGDKYRVDVFVVELK
jgi:hypothetical protein